jgi:hypothetical protein
MEQGECLHQVYLVQYFCSYWPPLNDPELQPKGLVQRVERYAEPCLSLADSWGGTLVVFALNPLFCADVYSLLER